MDKTADEQETVSVHENGHIESSNSKTEEDEISQIKSHKRAGYLEWPDYFMAVAFLSAQRSKDPSSQVGACIVNQEKRIVGIGYNGMPTGCDDDIMPWNREGESLLETKHAFGKRGGPFFQANFLTFNNYIILNFLFL